MKIKLKLYCECQFTRLGLGYAVEQFPELATRLVFSSCSVSRESMNTSRYSQAVPDIAILVLDHHIGRWLIQHNNEEETLWDDKTNVILIAPKGRFTGMINYLQDAMNVRAILDMNVGLIELQSLLLSIVRNPFVFEQDRRKLLVSPLSAREKTVIDGLLRGESPVQIATELGLSYKTVSTHKLTALRKLGVRSLQKLILWL